MNSNSLTSKDILTGDSSLPNPVQLSRQIDDLRKVLLRLRASRSVTLDPVMSKKLEQLNEQN